MVYGPPGFLVTVVTINTNRGAFEFVGDPTETAVLDQNGVSGSNDFLCRSRRDDIALLNFLVLIYSPAGILVDAFITTGGIGLTLHGRTPSPLDLLPKYVSVGAPAPNPNTGTGHLEYDGEWVTTTPGSAADGWFAGKPVSGNFRGLSKFDWIVTETSRAVGDEVTVNASLNVNGGVAPLPISNFTTVTIPEFQVGHPAMHLGGVFPRTTERKARGRWEDPMDATHRVRETIKIKTWRIYSVHFAPTVTATAKNTASAVIRMDVVSSDLDTDPLYPF